MPKLNATEKEAIALAFKHACKVSPEARFQHRLHCIQLVAQNYTAQEVAQCFDDDPSSIARWARHFKEYGIEGLREDQKTGRVAKLDYEQMQTLAHDLGQSPSVFGYHGTKWDGPLLVTHLRQEYHVEYSLRQCQRLIQQLKDSPELTKTRESAEAVE